MMDLGKLNKKCLFIHLFLIYLTRQLTEGTIWTSENLHKIWNSSGIQVPIDKNEDFFHFWRRAVLPTIKANPTFTVTQKSNFTSGLEFPCKALNRTAKPTSVHRLKPCDVDVVAALGDSVTAAFGAKSTSLLNLFDEFRGVSWSIGGDRTLDQVTTLPNILKKYNPKIKGFSVKTTPPLIPFPPNARLNVAVSGAIASDMPQQAKNLVRKLKWHPNIDFANDWKLVTIWIGGNDLCAYCKNDKHTAGKYIGGIMDALDILHKEVPKVLVNLVQILDVTRLNAMNSLYCKALHEIVCYCGTSAGEAMKKKVSALTLEYQRLVRALIDSGRYDTPGKDDFTVVLQPFFLETTIPHLPDGSVDMSYFAPDCFHFSEKGHASGAVALWNNMMEPVGQKRKMWAKNELLECPSHDFPYIFTNKNSKEYMLMQQNEAADAANAADAADQNGHSNSPQNKPVRVDVSKDKTSRFEAVITVALLGTVGFLCVFIGLFVVKKNKSGYGLIVNQDTVNRKYGATKA